MKPNSILDPKLYEAAKEGNIRLLEKLLKPEVHPYQEQGEVAVSITNGFPSDTNKFSCLSGVTCAGDTALHIAARFGQIEVAMTICEESISLLMRANNKLETPLHHAAQAGNSTLVKHFIGLARKEYSNIYQDELLRKRNQDGETALYHAIRHQHNKVVDELMHADVHLASIPDNQNISPLYLATMLGSLSIVNSLVEGLPLDVSRGAYSGPDGQTVLHDAALCGKKRFVEKFLEWRPELAKAIDNSGYTPLHYAASVNNFTAAKMLLEVDKISAYIPNSSGICPVHIAAIFGHLKVVIELFKHCPDSGELLDSQGRNFLHLAVENKRVGIVRWVCKNVIEFEKAMCGQDNQGNTPLHLAVKAGDPITVLHLILSTRVPFNWVNENEMTPLDIAHAQMNFGFSDPQNPEYVIYRILCWIGCSHHKHRSTFHNLDLEKNDKEKAKKEMKSCESMAKNMSIGSVLIASATFAAAFTVYGLYINKKDLYDSHHLKVGFEIFFLLDAYAFLCSIIATGLLVEAALTFLDLEFRKRYLLLSTALVTTAAKFFIISFIFAAYLVLIPVRKWLAIVITVMGASAPMLMQPRHWPDLLILWTLMRYRGCKALWWFGNQLLPLFSNACYILMVYFVLTGNLSHKTSGTLKLCRIIDCLSDPYLAAVIVYLVIISFMLFLGAVKDLSMKPRIKLRRYI